MNNSHNLMMYAGLCLAVSILACSCDGRIAETSTNRYSNHKEAMEDGALQRGWLPRNLPRSAHAIVETHNVDTNELLVKFELNQADITEFIRQCAETSYPQFPSSARTEKLALWWPKALTDKGGEQKASTMRAYHCSTAPHANEKIETTMVIDAQTKVIWYWSTP